MYSILSSYMLPLLKKARKMSFIETMGQQMAGEATGSLFGLALGAYNDQRQVRQQQKFTDMQIKGEQQMADYNFQKQFELWQKTNYTEQVKQMMKAGLNPGLLYGMGGAGGSTTGTPSAHVASGQAEQNPGEATAAMGMGIQTAMNAAQIELIKAQTQNVKAQTATEQQRPQNVQSQTELNLANTDNAKANTELQKMQTKLTDAQQQIANGTIEEQIKTATETADILTKQADILANDRFISDATRDTKVKQIKAELVGTYLRNNLTKEQTAALAQQILESKSNIEVNEATIREITASILQRWAGLGNDAERNRIQKNYTEKLINLGVGAEIIEGVGTLLGAMGRGGALQQAAKRNPIGFKF